MKLHCPKKNDSLQITKAFFYACSGFAIARPKGRAPMVLADYADCMLDPA